MLGDNRSVNHRGIAMKMEDRGAVRVWDLPIRLFHWVLVLLVALSWLSGQLNKLDHHMIVGTAVLALLLFRLAWGVAGSTTSRFGHFVKGPRAILDHLRGIGGAAIGHNPLGALSVLTLLAVLALQAASGLFTSDDIITDGPLAHLVSSRTVSQASTVHRIGFYVLLALIATHLAAIAFYRFARKDDLVTPMVTGEKRVPRGIQGTSGGNPWLALGLAAGSAALVWGGLAVWGR